MDIRGDFMGQGIRHGTAGSLGDKPVAERQPGHIFVVGYGIEGAPVDRLA
jgi:hypothetical protein